MGHVLATVAALIAVLVWIGFVAQTVMSLAEPTGTKLLFWAVAVPIVAVVEIVCLWTLERFHDAG